MPVQKINKMITENTGKKQTSTAADGQGRFVPGNVSAAYFADDVTVGDLIRWINAEAVRAGQTNDRDYLDALCRVEGHVESALSMYRIRRCDFANNLR